MKKIFLLSLLIISNAQAVTKEEVQQLAHIKLEEHYQWYKDHKHESPDIYYFYRLGYLDACEDVIKLID